VFLCERDSRSHSQHWKQKQWPRRFSPAPGAKNIAWESLVDPRKVLLPFLCTEVGLMKQFMEASQRDRICFKHISNEFTGLSQENLKEVIFVVFDIREFISDEILGRSKWNVEREASIAVKSVISIFWGNYSDQNKHHFGKLL
jgi:hypothetical protein